MANAREAESVAQGVDDEKGRQCPGRDTTSFEDLKGNITGGIESQSSDVGFFFCWCVWNEKFLCFL